jgi:hypothetical protein
MKPQVLILSILLVISVIFNIVLLQSDDTGDPGEVDTDKSKVQTVTAADINNLNNITSTLYTDLNRSSDRNIDWVAASSKRFLMQLQYLKKKAVTEQADQTVEAIDGMVSSMKDRLDKLAKRTGADISDVNRSGRDTTYQQRQERERRLMEQQGEQPTFESPNDR